MRIGGRTRQELVVVCDAEEERQVVVNVASPRIHQNVPDRRVEGIRPPRRPRERRSERDRSENTRAGLPPSGGAGVEGLVVRRTIVAPNLEHVASKLALGDPEKFSIFQVNLPYISVG